MIISFLFIPETATTLSLILRHSVQHCYILHNTALFNQPCIWVEAQHFSFLFFLLISTKFAHKLINIFAFTQLFTTPCLLSYSTASDIKMANIIGQYSNNAQTRNLSTVWCKWNVVSNFQITKTRWPIIGIQQKFITEHIFIIFFTIEIKEGYFRHIMENVGHNYQINNRMFRN